MRTLARKSLILVGALGTLSTLACRSPVRTQTAGMLPAAPAVPIDPPVEEPGQPDLDASDAPDVATLPDEGVGNDATFEDVVKPPTPVAPPTRK